MLHYFIDSSQKAPSLDGRGLGMGDFAMRHFLGSVPPCPLYAKEGGDF